MNYVTVHPDSIALQGGARSAELHLKNPHPFNVEWKIVLHSPQGPFQANPAKGILQASGTCDVSVAFVGPAGAEGPLGKFGSLNVAARPVTALSATSEQFVLCAQILCSMTKGPTFVDPSAATATHELRVARGKPLDPKLEPTTSASLHACMRPSPTAPSFDTIVSTGCHIFLLGSGQSSPKKTLGSYQAAFRAHSNTITCLVYSPDGRQLATSSADSEIHLWSTETAQRIRSLKGHRQPVSAISYFDSVQLVSSGCDGIAIVWDLATGSIIHWVECASDDITVAACADGVRFATIDSSHNVRLWDRWSGCQLQQLEDRTSSQHAVPLISPPKLCFDVTGTILATSGSNGVVKIWDLSPSEPELKSSVVAHLYEVTGLCFHRTGKQLATCGKDGAIHLWTVPELSRLSTYMGHSEIVYAVAFTADGTHLISAGSVESRPNVRIWDTQNRTCVQTLVGPTVLVTTLAAHPAGTEVAAATLNGGVYAWSTSALTVLGVLEGHSARVKHYSINSTKTKLASLDIANNVKVWDLPSCKCLATADAKAWLENSDTAVDQSLSVDQIQFTEGICVSSEEGKLKSKTLAVTELERMEKSSPSKSTRAEVDDLSALCLQLERRIRQLKIIPREESDGERRSDSRPVNPTVSEAFRMANAYLDRIAATTLTTTAKARLTELHEERLRHQLPSDDESSFSPVLAELGRTLNAFKGVDENLQRIPQPCGRTGRGDGSSTSSKEVDEVLLERDSTRRSWLRCMKELKASLDAAQQGLSSGALPRYDATSIIGLQSRCRAAVLERSAIRLEELLAVCQTDELEGDRTQSGSRTDDLAEFLERCAPAFIGAVVESEVHQRCKERDAERDEAATLIAAAQSLLDSAKDQCKLFERVESAFTSPTTGSQEEGRAPHVLARNALDHFVRVEMWELLELKDNLSNLTRKIQGQSKFGLAVDPTRIQERDELDVQVTQKSAEFRKHYQALIPILREGFPELVPELHRLVDPHCGHNSMRWDISLADFETDHDPASLGRSVSVRHIRPKSRETKQLRAELERYVLKSFHSNEDQEFLREVEVMERAVHRNIATLEFTFMDQGTKYLALPFYPATAPAWFQRHLIEPDSILRVLLEMVEGVAHLHSVGVIHADIKPDNLMFSDPGIHASPKWLDFNFSLLTHERTQVMLRAATAPVSGTAGFMAPELVTNPESPPTAAIDVFGLGATMKALIGIGSGNESPLKQQGADTLRRGLGGELFTALARLLESMTEPAPEQRPPLGKPHCHLPAVGLGTKRDSCWELLESLQIQWSTRETDEK